MRGVSLYRTWRPRSFDDLVGQDAVVRTLRTAIASGKLAHAYLFSGPRGSGKTSAAKILARCVNCAAGPTATPDNACEACREMLAGTALDVQEIDAASNRGIDEIRALREAAKFAPATMRKKVFIVDEAHMLTREGANAFLKTLEEPPPHVLFILATTAPESLPATILSRCQRYAFRRIPIDAMIGRMRLIADAEGIPVGDDALGAIAYRADGGLRDALTMLEQTASFAPPGTRIDATIVEAAFGSTGRVYARALVTAILGNAGADALRIVDEASDAGADMGNLIRGALAEYRHLLVARIEPALLARDLAPEDARAAERASAATPQPKLVRGLRLLGEALAAARTSGNARLELETALLRLLVQHEDPQLDALAARVAMLEAGPAERGGALKAARPVGARGAGPGALLGDEIEGIAPLDAALSRMGEGADPYSESPDDRNTPLPPDAEDAVAPPSSPATEPLGTDVVEHEASAPLAGDEAAVAARLLGGTPAGAAPNASPDPATAFRAAISGAPITARAALFVPADEAARPPSETPSLQRVRSQWQSVRTRAASERASLRAAFARATVDAVDAESVTVRHGDEAMASFLRSSAEIVERAMRDVLGRPMRLIVRTEAGASAERPAHEADDAPRAANEGGEPEPGLLAYARRQLGRSKAR